MGLIHLIAGCDIEGARVTNHILTELNQHHSFLYISATSNIKGIRKEQFKNVFRSYSSQKKDSQPEPNLFTFLEFQKWISYQVFMGHDYISTPDQKYILAKLIELAPNLDPTTQKALQRMKHELYDLYKFLLFYDKDVIPPNILTQIENDFSITERIIFDLYNSFRKTLHDVVKGIREGNLEKQDIDPSILKLFKSNIRMEIDLYLNKVKAQIDHTIRGAEAVFMDGFLFFDDLQKYVIASAIESGKRVNLVAKYSVSDRTNSFLFEDNYLQLSKELGHEISLPVVDEEEYTDDSALDFFKVKYPHFAPRVSVSEKDKLKDDSIIIVKPFPNRDKELQYIVNRICELVQEKALEDEARISEFLKNDVAIVLAIEKEKYEERLSALFKDVGVFIYKGDDALKNTEYVSVNADDLRKIWYRKKEFLAAKLRYQDGQILSFDEKFKLFHLAYRGIEIRKTPRPIASYPIGQFIIQLYNIITQGMTVDGFKMILYSNWHYNVNKSDSKWDRYISQFKNIQVFFEQLSAMDQWKIEAEKILARKYEIENDPLFKWHPWNHIDTEFILFLIHFLNELSIIIASLKDIEGSIEDHIEELKNNVLDAEKILKLEPNDLKFEQKIIQKFHKAIDEIGKSSIVDGLDSNYFAENLKGMLVDWEKEQESEDEQDDLKINVVSLENMHKYRISFFMMLEADKYPRKYMYEFPFTPEILQIMNDPQYGIEQRPAEIHGVDYHLSLEQYLFKNVLDFTKDKLVITMTEKEDKTTHKPSIYIEDITSMFDTNIEEVHQSNEIRSTNSFTFDGNRRKTVYLPKKSTYTIAELGMFKLCPRLYFHLHYKNQDAHVTYTNWLQLKFYCERVLYCLLFERFKEYNEATQSIYTAHNDQYYFVLKSLLNQYQDQVTSYFDFLNEYELKDIRNQVLHTAVEFIVSSAIEFSRLNEFRVINCNDHSDNKGNYERHFEFENDLLITDSTKSIKRRYQNKVSLDFLLRSTREKIDPAHTRDISSIINYLDGDDSSANRMGMVNKLIFWLNIYFTSNSNHARSIAKSIESTDFLQSKAQKSKFCMYCIVSDICKGNQQISKEENHEL